MEPLTEAEISMILDTYMYFDYQGAGDYQTLNEIMADISADQELMNAHPNEYAILSQACQDPRVGELRICCQSKDMGFNEGTRAAAFVNSEDNITYISFRGTADGEWLDNGEGLTSEGTPQQREALRYYETVVEELELEAEDTVYLGGHSKGGNKVQYITMETQYADVLDRTYSCDGQGQSKKAIARWKSKYSPEEYERRTQKLYGINGQNDFVHVLGTGIIPAAHISYIKTPSEKLDFVGYHDITRMFATQRTDETGRIYYDYSSRSNKEVLRRGELSDYVAGLSGIILFHPDNVADGSCATVMQFAELVNKGRITGLNGERIGLLDLMEFRFAGITSILASLISKDGRGFLDVLANKEVFSQKLSPDASLEVNYLMLDNVAQALKSIIRQLEGTVYEIDRNSLVLPLLFEGYSFRRRHVESCVASIRLNMAELGQLSSTLSKIAELYREFDMA